MRFERRTFGERQSTDSVAEASIVDLPPLYKKPKNPHTTLEEQETAFLGKYIFEHAEEILKSANKAHILKLRLVEEMSFPEIAETLERTNEKKLSIDTIKKTYTRALKALREYIEHRLYPEVVLSI